MADPPPYPDSDVGPDRVSTPGTPRWVKVFGVIAIVVVVLLLGVRMFGPGGGGGGHGPDRHAPPAGAVNAP